MEQKKLGETHLFAIDATKFGKANNFGPSGIAVHPLSGDIYVLSSRGKILVQLDAEGKYLDAWKLDKKNFKQPEGICFAPNGDMYISNEGRGGKANLLHFKWKSR